MMIIYKYANCEILPASIALTITMNSSFQQENFSITSMKGIEAAEENG